MARRLKTDEISFEARMLFKEIGVDPKVLASLDIIIEEENTKNQDEIKEVEITEKNATAYLFRRNYATNLKILGFELSEPLTQIVLFQVWYHP